MMHKKKRILLNDQFDEFQYYVTDGLLKKSSWTGPHRQVLMDRSSWTGPHGQVLMDRKSPPGIIASNNFLGISFRT